MFCKETSKVVFLKNVCSGAEGERNEYCLRQCWTSKGACPHIYGVIVSQGVSGKEY